VKLSGQTKPFAVLGHPIGHTLSPVMHNAAFKALGIDAVYLAFDVEPSRLMNVLPAMGAMGFGGVNLTVPLKEVAFKSLQNLDESASMLGAVNTIEYTADGVRGHNTDGNGFLHAMQEAFGTAVSGLSVFIIGTGGAGRAVAIACAAEAARRITVTDLATDRARRVADEISQLVPNAEIKTVPVGADAWTEACQKADLVVQATPVGMKKEDRPLLRSEAFHSGHLVFDLVYMYPETAFMSGARRAGARIANGLGMLLHQGALSFSIWTGRKAAMDIMRKALEEEVYGRPEER